ncbi:MAG: ABC transporter permease [Lachnospiraceae bacterium]|nr:ABC transporter permease [Lachnospiraceae bacterium]
MRTFITLIDRNRKLFFKDKGMLLSSLITPIILIVLYATFLAKVYKDSFTGNIPAVLDVSEKLINGTVAGQLAAALLAVSCVTVTFCVNLTMVQDRALGVRKDFDVSPIRKPLIYLGYFFSTVLNSLMVNVFALALCLGYIGIMGWYLTVTDVALLMLDLLILVLFGAVLSSIVCYPLKTQGQMSAVGTIVSAGYGFVCGAYMPISNFGEGLQKVMSYLPGTYGTALIKNHMLRGVFKEMETKGFPAEVVNGIATSLDCNPTFQGNVVEPEYMMLIMIGTVVLLGGLYLLITALPEKK